MKRKTPVAVFAYRRPDHLAKALDSLFRCTGYADHPVFIFSDGPKDPQSAQDVIAVRALIRARKTPNMTIVERAQNNGLANSIIGAVTELCDKHGSAIVIEDDLILHPSALQWFENALEVYLRHDWIMHIGAYQYVVPEFRYRRECTFQKFTSSWGWATWKRAWDHFDPAATGWQTIRENPEVRRSFDLEGAYPFAEMLERQMTGRIDSWAIRWWWSVFRAGGASVMPPQTLVRNIGFDSSATHNSVGFIKRFVSGPQPPPWDHDGFPTLPRTPLTRADDEIAFRRALLRTNAQRNSRIKRALAASGFKRFA